jgi:hypothetical protein
VARPQPLPPAERTVGQLVAETIRLYGDNFWRVLPLGLVLAVVNQLSLDLRIAFQALVLAAATPAITFAYVRACAIALGARATLTAFAIGCLVFLPVAGLTLVYVLPGLAWLALFGLAVPAAMMEGLGPRAALVRGFRLGTADYVHALGSIATLTILFALTKIMLALVLQTQGDNELRVAVFLADLVVSPIVFLGAALLYVDQAARVGESRGAKRVRRRSRANLRDADDAHRAGRPDAEVEP